MKLTAKRIIKEIGSKWVSLHKGDGYWYFTYDRPDAGIFETHSVMTMRLSDLGLSDWASEGAELVANVEEAQ